jgi:hypothetical protein
VSSPVQLSVNSVLLYTESPSRYHSALVKHNMQTRNVSLNNVVARDDDGTAAFTRLDAFTTSAYYKHKHEYTVLWRARRVTGITAQAETELTDDEAVVPSDVSNVVRLRNVVLVADVGFIGIGVLVATLQSIHLRGLELLVHLQRVHCIIQ